MTALGILALGVCLVCVAILLGVIVATHRRNRQLEASAEQLQATAQLLGERAAALAAENASLAKYRAIADAEARAVQILRTAQTESAAVLDVAHDEAGRTLAAARAQAEAMTAAAVEEASVAKQRSRALKGEAKTALDAATVEAERILLAARKRAEEIAGDAYQALAKAAQSEATVQAMRNIIEGYGDRYLIPGHSMLDELADELAHTDAGAELKRARERTRAMVRNGTAASCQYVQQKRRDTAVSFLIDAFNGKVDSTLSRVRHDNAGTLAQEIRDAFTLVNFNGTAFRDAQINELYLAARLDELKWAAVAQELKLADREEQRRLKEKIREEEKARKEYERAIRESAKEEDALRRAMEKAQQQIEKATAEQRAKYEEQLLDLSRRLREAEERSQRAVSMAQLTRRGHVYVISNLGSFGEDIFKIGLTRRLEPLDRIRELGDSSVPFEFDVHALIFSDDAPALETQLHKHFVLGQLNKVNHRKEFFRVKLHEIKEELDSLGIVANWTMTAAAREYRESRAIEKAIQSDPAARDAWVRRQLDFEGLEYEPVDDDMLLAVQ